MTLLLWAATAAPDPDFDTSTPLWLIAGHHLRSLGAPGELERAYLNFTVPQGSTWSRSFSFFADDRVERSHFSVGEWTARRVYREGTVALAHDDVWYVAVAQSFGDDPVNASGAWSPMVPMDLTGYTLTLAEGAVTLTVGSGLVVAQGVVTVTLSAAQTAAQAGNQRFSLRWTDPLGAVEFPAAGVLTFC